VIHETACIDPGASIGERTAIWHFCHVRARAVIGSDCTLGQNVYVDDEAVIGDRVKIQNNVSVFRGVQLLDDVFVGPSAVFTNVKNPRSPFPTDARDYQPTRVLRGASIGANATIVCGATIGAWAFVGAGAVVVGAVPDYALMVGVPARQIGWMCQCGRRLDAGAASACCPACDRRYDLENGKLSPR
jgi:UDP-2-acetamido-3-amino-2,3-dideoxy-glucuronate N-acetyltransferase